jgi:hypothetical protein
MRAQCARFCRKQMQIDGGALRTRATCECVCFVPLRAPRISESKRPCGFLHRALPTNIHVADNSRFHLHSPLFTKGGLRCRNCTGFTFPAVAKRLFFHPDYTVGPGISPGLPDAAFKTVVSETMHKACGLYRRSGISPCPEVRYFLDVIMVLH